MNEQPLPPPSQTTGDRAPRRVVLVGNPNVGKSALFTALTGHHVTVSNYPGTTVEITRGRLKGAAAECEVVDSPGVNSLLPLSEDEQVTASLVASLKKEDGESVVVQVADAKNLRRALLVTLELGQLGMRTVLDLNMTDEAEGHGIEIDTEGLAATLGIPVRATVATRARGVRELVAAFPAARVPRNDLALPAGVRPAVDLLRAGETPTNGKADLALLAGYNAALLRHADVLVSRHVRRRRSPSGAWLHPDRFSHVLGSLSLHPVWGWPILLVVLAGFYFFVGMFGAGTLVDWLEHGLFGHVINPAVSALFAHVPWAFVRDLFVGPYGAVTVGLTYGLAIILPIVTTFFIAFAITEDSGYLPRLAVMMDRFFRIMGLNGKAVLPMVLGLGCDTMATMTTRILATRKERLLATLLLALGVPCSAQLGVVLAMLAVVPASAGLLWFLAIAGTMVIVGWLAARLLPGSASAFVIELPPMRRPSIANVLAKTGARVEWYLKEAVPLFMLGTFSLFVLDRVGALPALIRLGEPLVVGLLGLPREAAEAFLVGFLRRDFAATRLFDMSRSHGLSTIQLVVSMVTITLFIPCIANVFVIIKERGLKVALAMVAIVFPLAFAVGGLMRWLMVTLGLWGAA
jgi:ferrous iron transport protein B